MSHTELLAAPPGGVTVAGSISAPTPVHGLCYVPSKEHGGWGDVLVSLARGVLTGAQGCVAAAL